MYINVSSTPQANAPTPKPVWTSPAITIIPLRAAAGAVAGPLCDKHGSLSRGTNC